jgi:hypothetical protein
MPMAFKQDEIDALLPLPPATFHILMAVADEDRHGYAIMLERYTGQFSECRNRG